MAEVLDESDWLARAEAHRRRVGAFLGPRVFGARADRPHPVWDFLFNYYSLRPGQLLCWHPGYGTVLVGDDAQRRYCGRRGYTAVRDGVTVSDAFLHSRLGTIESVARLLRATAQRPAQLNCFGLHEWAFAYRSNAVRHRQIPLRLGAPETDALVESMPLRCSHFDAFRFFTAPFKAEFVPGNCAAPSRATQQDWEQPGCLHTNMDLYKWCYKLIPLIDSELLCNCVELAAAAREIDMRASPYDLSDYGYSPIAVENRAGRAEYVRCQNAIAQRAVPLRKALLARCDLLLRV